MSTDPTNQATDRPDPTLAIYCGMEPERAARAIERLHAALAEISKLSNMNDTSDTQTVVRARLANGKHIADADIVRLCDEIDHLRALIKSIARHGT